MDSFLHDHRHCGTLEEIRDDLGLYLKTLRFEMIELINEDYADFVNLSANLIGLDKSIGEIVHPLQSLREELMTIKTDLQSSMDQIEKCLRDKEQMRRLHQSLQSITRLSSTTQNLQQLLSVVDSPHDPIHIERVTVLLCHLNSDLGDCSQFLKPDQLHSVKVLDLQSMDLLKTFFLDALRNGKKKNLEVSLRLYSMLNSNAVVENVYRAEVLKPHFLRVISEQSLQNSPKGLAGIYDQVIGFIETNMRDVLTLSRQVDESNYDFLLHSFWPEVEHRLEVNMSSIFAPGNPNFFYQKYQSTVEILAKFETFASQPEAFRTHKQYQTFLARWNLPVYFQIRFQEIGGAVETELSRSFGASCIKEGAVVKLVAVATALENIHRCWADGVYLDPLLARFLKLTLQIFGRLSSWLNSLIRDDTIDYVALKLTRTEFMVLIYGDLQQLKASIPPLIVLVKSLMKCAANVSIDRCFSDATDLLKTNETLLLAEVAKELFTRSQVGIRQVTDIPRLYRKTNREIPTKPCPYVDEMAGPVVEFQKRFRSALEVQHLTDTMTSVLSQINAQ